jgi:putative phosphoesterase
LRIALIGDIHGNLPALEAVLAHAQQKGVDVTWNLGDFVGYGPFPDEVVKELWRREVTSILGNYDRKVLKIYEKPDKWNGHKNLEKLLAFQWAYDHLSRESRFYLQSLREQLLIKLGELYLLMTHGSPLSRSEHLTPDTPEDRLRGLTHTTRASIILCAHSHQPFSRHIDNVWFVNPGSVGRPDDGDPQASYAILSINPDQFQAELFRIPYDLEKEIAAIRAAQLPEEFVLMAQLGRSLDWVLAQTKEKKSGP